MLFPNHANSLNASCKRSATRKKNAIEATVFKWTDSRENRAANSELFVLLNNGETEVAASAIDALKNYDIEPILWTERSQIVERLVA
ncbi:DUF1829 domain-containing protein [Glaesserella parasuis]|uniref:DUF1829 domain-containing protein n=1 Tax=Glaesserella parasuis TaxID=738 RepID=UPI0024371E5A|nr:DUF1829 domain-containing protein [Glaesserella parasuis]MDG6265284.1 DUF1829 domain-containing protein [Glaesserella parasuis]MDO9993440.1 DUF1829 domain-containing protein [Glaesserella parasuis]MDP0101445.1 DUF1829 domain-containing protein [Glaesserella parasuis]MDP0232337.1 DUF1829 domain-containing protein [Glaesserella parasuis]